MIPANPTDSPFPEYMQAQQGARKKTHRGRRSRGKGPKEHQADAKTHIENAQKEPTPKAALGHLFKAVRSLHAAAKPAQEPAQEAL